MSPCGCCRKTTCLNPAGSYGNDRHPVAAAAARDADVCCRLRGCLVEIAQRTFVPNAHLASVLEVPRHSEVGGLLEALTRDGAVAVAGNITHFDRGESLRSWVNPLHFGT